ncbi:MAG: hypothetical protein ACFE9N_16195 [Promethearchaeota archaeon]
MDCYDEILKLSQEKKGIINFMIHLSNLINKKSKNLTELEFKNCIILTLAIWNPEFIDLYCYEGLRVNQLDKNKEAQLINVLKSEFRNFDS